MNSLKFLRTPFSQSTFGGCFFITENTRKALHDRNIGWKVFVDLEKAFDAKVHQILLAKLSFHEIRGVSNDWFKSHLFTCNQHISITRYDPGLAAINYVYRHGSVPGLSIL